MSDVCPWCGAGKAENSRDMFACGSWGGPVNYSQTWPCRYNCALREIRQLRTELEAANSCNDTHVSTIERDAKTTGRLHAELLNEIAGRNKLCDLSDRLLKEREEARAEVEQLKRELFDRESKIDAYALKEQELENALATVLGQDKPSPSNVDNAYEREIAKLRTALEKYATSDLWEFAKVYATGLGGYAWLGEYAEMPWSIAEEVLK